MSQRWFKVGCLGLGTPATLPAGGYLYRVCPIAKLTSYAHDWFSVNPRKEAQAPLIFRLWKEKVEAREQAAGGGRRVWLPLREYARGKFYSPRKFTFWTGHELDPSDPARLLASTRTLGLPDDWLDPPYCVVMRCRTSALGGPAQVQTPTTLDGFDSHIFHPRREAAAPPSGVTIELSLTPPLHRGLDEYAVGPVEASAIEVYPVRLPQTTNPSIHSRDSRLLVSLHVYYSGL